MMDGVSATGAAAIITALSVFILGLMTALGTALKYVITLVLDAYKAQASATTDAKDREITSKDARINRIERDRDEQREVIKDQREVIRDLREQVRELRDEHSR